MCGLAINVASPCGDGGPIDKGLWYYIMYCGFHILVLHYCRARAECLF